MPRVIRWSVVVKNERGNLGYLAVDAVDFLDAEQIAREDPNAVPGYVVVPGETTTLARRRETMGADTPLHFALARSESGAVVSAGIVKGEA